MNDKLQAELQSRIESFAADITAILQRAVTDSVADALGNGGRRGRPGRPSSVRSLDPEVVLREVKRKPGQRVEELARNLATSTQALKAPIASLLEQKKLKKGGVARGTNYRPA